ncbi:MAG: tRNA pseudouridine(55) synthase TruB [Candidatus Eisenbacteria bacterium]
MSELQRHLLEDRVLNIDKGDGVTSCKVVERVKRLFRLGKVGHAGSLDPFATGVLLVCTGNATKITRFLMDLEKEYRGTIRLGVETDTDDSTGQATAPAGDFSVSEEELRDAVAGFRGRILQRPPRVSALKHQGRRLYQMAREGQEFDAAPREVVIHEFTLSRFESPHVEFRLRCSRGTYVRAIARDVGRKLGCGAHLASLRRTAVGGFTVEDAVTLDELRARADELNRGVLPEITSKSTASVDEALSFLTAVFLRQGVEERVLHGHSPACAEIDRAQGELTPEEPVRVVSFTGELLAVGRLTSSRGEDIVKLERLLSPSRG